MIWITYFLQNEKPKWLGVRFETQRTSLMTKQTGTQSWARMLLMSWLFISPSGLEMCFSEGAGKHMEGIKNKFIRSSWSGESIKRNSVLHQMSKWIIANTNQRTRTCHLLFTCWCQVGTKVDSQPHCSQLTMTHLLTPTTSTPGKTRQVDNIKWKF